MFKTGVDSPIHTFIMFNLEETVVKCNFDSCRIFCYYSECKELCVFLLAIMWRQNLMKKSMNKIALGLMVATVITTFTACSSSNEGQNDSSAVSGTFSGVGQGLGGDITVDVTLEEGKITKVEVVSAEHETEGVADPAIEQMPQKFVDAQGTDVDTVSGATVTSNGIIDAVKAALAEAGL